MLIDSQSGFLSLKLIDKLTTLTEKTATVLHIPSQSSYKVHTHTHTDVRTLIIAHTHTHTVAFTFSKSYTQLKVMLNV